METLVADSNELNVTLQVFKLLVHNCDPFDSSESDSASWEIEQVTLKDEGYYECIAINSAGTGRARTFLDVSGKPTPQGPPVDLQASFGH